MNQYTQLSQEERYEIYIALKSKTSLSEIARQLNRSKSTISREVKRNRGQRGYRAKQAHELSQQRCYRKTSTLCEFAYAYISHLILQNWSPEQIHGALTERGWVDVLSHEWIYQYVYQDKRNGGTLYTSLRHQKAYRKRGFKNNDRRGQMPNRRIIHERDIVIQQRQRIGDFEGDTIIGQHHKGAVLTLVEHKSLYVHIVHLGETRGQKIRSTTV